jgi:hypothetical protein
MKIANLGLMVLAGVLGAGPMVSGASGNISGTWNTVVKLEGSARLLVVYEPTFEFKVDGDKLTGVARMGGWPGNGTISDGKVDGDRFSFTVTHEQPYRTNGREFYVTYSCTGMVHGNEFDLTMVSAEGNDPGRVTLEMKGMRARE